MKYLISVACISAIACMFLQCAETSSQTMEGETTVRATLQDTIDRGHHLVEAVGCHDCHTPKRMGEMGPELVQDLLLSGYPGDRPFEKPHLEATKQGWYLMNPDLTAFIGPWGVSFSANLTSDETGIGNWTLDQFLVAMREGKSKGLNDNRPLLPPMPWQAYGQFSDEDLAAIFTYLKSTKPIRNVVPPPIPPDQL